MVHTVIHTVYLYKRGQSWVFDDPTKDIKGEALVSGIDEMITQLVSQLQIKHAEVGMILRFSDDPFPQQQLHLEWLALDDMGMGNWYYCPEMNQQGWLCPVLYRYYQEAPARLYAFLGELPHTKQRILQHYLKRLAGC